MKSLGTLVAIAVMGAAGAGNCLADQVQISDAGSAYRIPSFGGGAFRATTVSGYVGETGGFGGTASSFLTFCIERNELVSLGGTYYATIDTVARNGGVGGPSPDPISPVTAALYSQFRYAGSYGNLPGLGNNLLDTASEIRSLQRAIWHAEDEISGSEYTNDTLAVALYNWAVANNNGTIGNVRVLNLWGNVSHTQLVQDQLTIVPLPPASWASIGSLAGVVGLGYLRRRAHRD